MKAQEIVGGFQGNFVKSTKARRAKLAGAVAAVAMGLMVSAAARGADLFWDTNGATSGGGGSTAPGIWGTDDFWNPVSDGTGATGPWIADSNAVFSAGTGVTGAHTVTVNGTQSVANMTFEEGTVTLTGGTLNLTGGTITNSSANNQTIASIVSGSVGLTKMGSGTLTLTNANTYSGTTFIGDPVQAPLGAQSAPNPAQPNGGIIIISNSNALGTSVVNFQRTRIDNDPTANVLVDAYTGRLYLTNNITVANTITLTNGSGNAHGPGQLDNLSGDNTWSGNIILNGQVNNLGNGLSTIGVQAGTLTITGLISNGTAGFPSWAKTGAGTIVITGGIGNNTYTGLTRVFGGTLIAEKDQAFGTSGGGVFMNLTSQHPVTVGIRAPTSSPTGFTYNTGDLLSIAGFPHDNLGQGLIHNFSGDNIYTGNGNSTSGTSISLANTRPTSGVNPLFPGLPGMSGFQYTNSVSAAAGSSIEFKNPMVNPVNAQGAVADPRQFQKFGPGNVTFSAVNINVGAELITEGPFTFRGNGGWVPNTNTTAAFASMMSVSSAATLRFDNSLQVKTNRFGTAVPVNIEAGTFELIGNATADTLQGVVGGGLNAIGDAAFTVTNPGATTTSLGIAPADPVPVVGGFNRIGRATALLRGTNLGASASGVSQIFLDASLSTRVGELGGTGTKIGILPFATGDASGTAAGATGFVTYDVNGVRHLDEATEYAAGITSGSTDLVNASVSAPQAVLTNTTVNSIRITSGGSSITIDPGAILTVNSGAVLNGTASAAAIIGGTLNFGSVEGVITTPGDLNISSVISGNNGVTKSGRGTLTLAADNTFSGPLTINGGNLAFTSETQLGTGNVVLAGGYLKPEGTQSLNASRGVTLSSLYTGVNVNAGETLTINGTIDGTGALTKIGPGTLVLTGSNSYQSGTNFKEGVVSISSDGQLGAGAPIAFDGGTLRITANTTLASNRPIYLSGNNGTFDVPAGVTATSAAYIIGGGSLIKKGAGTLNFQGAIAQSTYIGSTQITEGTVEYTGTNGLGYSPSGFVPDYWIISNGATIQAGFTSTGTAGISAANRGITIIDAAKMDVNSDPSTSIPNIWLYSSIITGNGTLTKTGPGELRLGTANTFNGKTTVAGGTLSIGNDNRLGVSITADDAITLDGGTIGSLAATNITIGTPRGILLTANNGTLKPLTGTTITYGGKINGPGNLTKADVGTLALTGTSTYTGTTSVDAGLLRVNGSLTGGGTMTVKSAATIGGTGSVLSQVNVEPGGHVAAGVTVGTLTLTGLALDTAQVDVDGATTGFDRINVTGADRFTLAGNSSVNVSGTFDLPMGGEFVIIDYAGAPLADISGLSLSSTSVSGYNLSLYHDTANTQIKLRVGTQPPPQWRVDSDGSWGDGPNWSTFVEPNGPTDVANFFGAITQPRTVSLNGAKTVNQVHFNNANAYTLAAGTGGSLTVTGGGAEITVEQGNHVISAPVTLTDDTNLSVSVLNTFRLDGGLSVAAGRTMTKNSAGTLVIGGTQNHAVGTTLRIAQGMVVLNSDAGTPATAGSAAVANLSVQVANAPGGGGLSLNSHQNLKELMISYSDADVQSLDLASSATAGDYHGIHVYASDLDGTKLALWAAIKNARDNAADGIYDSGLHGGSGIGVALVPDAYGSPNVYVRSTRTGDLNLDGTVTIADFIRLASNFNSSGPGVTWQEGDINYDGGVTIADFITLASNFNQAYTGTAGAISPEDRMLLSSFALSNGVDPAVIGSGVVPEPGVMGMLAVGAVGLMGRRRRR